jgi:hypothetical protein
LPRDPWPAPDPGAAGLAPGQDCGPELAADGRARDPRLPAPLLDGDASSAGRPPWYCWPSRGLAGRLPAGDSAFEPPAFAIALPLISSVEASAAIAGLFSGSGRSVATDAQ